MQESVKRICLAQLKLSLLSERVLGTTTFAVCPTTLFESPLQSAVTSSLFVTISVSPLNSLFAMSDTSRSEHEPETVASPESEGQTRAWRKCRSFMGRLDLANAAKKTKQAERQEEVDAEADADGSESDFFEAVDDWVMVLPVEQRKELAVTLFVGYRRRQKMGVLDAAKEAASATGFAERTVRRYWKEWCENGNGGSFVRTGDRLRTTSKGGAIARIYSMMRNVANAPWSGFVPTL